MINQTNKSIELLDNFLKHEQEIDFNIVNMICELYIKVTSKYWLIDMTILLRISFILNA